MCLCVCLCVLKLLLDQWTDLLHIWWKDAPQTPTVSVAPAIPEPVIKNTLGIFIRKGDLIVIGNDVDSYDFAKVLHVHPENSYLDVEYQKYESSTKFLKVWKKSNKAWVDRCHSNTIIMKLQSSDISDDLLQSIRETTNTLYGD